MSREFVMRAEVDVLGSQDLGARSPGNVTAGPWTARDAYVAETAITLDRLLAKVERLERRDEALTARIAELSEHAQQASRLQSLSESLRNSRDYKVGELTRQIKDLRTRTDAIEGPRSALAGLACKSLVDIDSKLSDLSKALTPRPRLSREKFAHLLAAFLVGAGCVLAGGYLI